MKEFSAIEIVRDLVDSQWKFKATDEYTVSKFGEAVLVKVAGNRDNLKEAVDTAMVLDKASEAVWPKRKYTGSVVYINGRVLVTIIRGKARISRTGNKEAQTLLFKSPTICPYRGA